MISSIYFSVGTITYVSCSFGLVQLCHSRFLVHLLAFMIVLPTIFILKLKGFSYSAGFCFIVTIIMMCLLCLVFGSEIVENGVSSNYNEFHFSHVFGFFASICYCLGGITMIFPIRGSLPNSDKKCYRKIFRPAYLTSAFLYIVFATLANLAMGNKLRPMIFDNFSSKDNRNHLN